MKTTTKVRSFTLEGSLAIAAAVAGLNGMMQLAHADVIFDNLPAVTPGNVDSLGYQANQTAEFGNKITFAGTDRDVTNVRILMSDWASQADWPGVGDATGFDHPITVNIYAAGPANAVGALVSSVTQTVHVPWHTVNGFNGVAFTADFNFGGVTVPDTAIISVAYNTETWGANPIGVDGPYDSLNYGLITGVPPTIGTDVDPDDAYWNTMTPGNYTDGGAGGVGTFRRDTNWTPYVAAMQVSAVPEPTTLGLLGVACLGLVSRRRK